MDDKNQAKTQNYDEERKKLISFGLPENVVDYALAFKPSRLLYWILSIFVLLLLLMGFYAGYIAWGYFENRLDQNAITFAKETQSFLYSHNFGVAGLIALFGWIFAVGAIVYSLHNYSEFVRATIFVYNYLDPRNSPYIGIFRNSSLDTETDPGIYMKESVQRWVRLSSWPAIFLVFLSVVTLEREMNTFSAYSEKGYIAKPLFPWESSKNYRWEDVESVELGCNHVSGRNPEDDIIYDISFKDGVSVRPSGAIPVSGGIVENIERIDVILRNINVEFRRWEWLKRESLHPNCLGFYKQKFSPSEYSRLEKLLRVGKL